MKKKIRDLLPGEHFCSRFAPSKEYIAVRIEWDEDDTNQKNYALGGCVYANEFRSSRYPNDITITYELYAVEIGVWDVVVYAEDDQLDDVVEVLNP